MAESILLDLSANSAASQPKFRTSDPSAQQGPTQLSHRALM
jgi:hypothetical protein